MQLKIASTGQIYWLLFSAWVYPWVYLNGKHYGVMRLAGYFQAPALWWAPIVSSNNGWTATSMQRWQGSSNYRGNCIKKLGNLYLRLLSFSHCLSLSSPLFLFFLSLYFDTISTIPLCTVLFLLYYFSFKSPMISNLSSPILPSLFLYHFLQINPLFLDL